LIKKFPFYRQPDAKDCGPTCLKIIAKHFGKTFSISDLRRISETTREGSSLLNLSDTAEKLGFRTLGVKLSAKTLKEAPLPCILHWNNDHYVVLYKIKKGVYYVSDPGHGLIQYSESEFLDRWIGKNSTIDEENGIALLIEPTPKFNKYNSVDDEQSYGFGFLFQYVFRYKKFITQLIIGLLAGSLLQLVVPFLTQSVVDVGIKNDDINFVYLILFAQITLFIGRSSIEVVRSWILLHLSTRINISLVSDFFIKLMNLPIAFFDTKMTGDILQRINDHKRIESILTTSSLNVLFSAMTFLIFSAVLAYYSLPIFGIFLLGSALYFSWILIFLKKRKELDYKRFSQVSDEQSKVIELINGMQEIKLHNAEKRMRWNWEHVQARLFNISIKNLALEQYQSVGSSLINELKNIIITVLSAKFVIDGSITLGMMLAISYIVGQLNSPIQQFITFVRQLQDARISLERLGEIHDKEDEESIDKNSVDHIKSNSDINIRDVYFKYVGNNDFVLKNLSLKIPANKITAIVGVSGSGKTTLMKLLLKFYSPSSGKVSLEGHDLNAISSKTWRDKCGVVMQEGFIFNDTIAQNIAVGEDNINYQRLENAAKVANITSYIENLALGYNTKIGLEGIGLSTGQKQRLLIARSVYKNPEYLFFDEATSALDANNEKVIMENLDVFFKDKTVFIIAHRLSTVKNADQIVVLDKGSIIEQGTHKELVKQKGSYYNLVKNQLELGT
jgi:ATP-binding cassette subfamily B protein